MIADFAHPCWPMVAAFLSREDQFLLLGLCRAVVDSPLRRGFFEQTMWRIPTDMALANWLVKRATMRQHIKRAQVEEAWQKDLLFLLPALEAVRFVPYEGMYFSRELPWRIKHLDFSRASVCLADAELQTSETLALEDGMCPSSTIKHFEKEELRSLTVRTLEQAEAARYFRYMRKLRSLTVTQQADFDSSMLLSLSRLKELTLRGHEFSTSRGLLAIAPRLEVLDIRGSELGEARFRKLAKRLVNMRRLNIMETDVIDADLTPLARLVELRELHVSASPVANWSPIASLSKLRLLFQLNGFQCCDETSVRALEGLPELTTIKCRDKANSLLENVILPRLEVLHVASTDSDPIRFPAGHFPRVRELVVYYGVPGVACVAPSLPKLKKLDLYVGTQFKELDSLAALTRLEYLRIQSETLSWRKSDEAVRVDLSMVRNMTRLRTLILKDLPVDDISVLAELKLLRFVNLKSTLVLDVSCLRGHPNLSRLRIPKDAECAPFFGPHGSTLPSISEIRHGGERRCLWCHSWKGDPSRYTSVFALQ